MPNFERHVFVCLNERDTTAARPSCGHNHSKKIRSLMKDAVKDAGLKGRVRVNESGCLDQCEHGPVTAVYPEGVWYGFVQPEDVEEIVREHLIQGRPVERLRLAQGCLNTKKCAHRES